eukprot:2682497-Amphidinium_carterae.1
MKGEYETLYTIPQLTFSGTVLKTMNAVGLNPKDDMLYGSAKIGNSAYLCRFGHDDGETKVLLLKKFQQPENGLVWSGAFDPNPAKDSYWYRDRNDIYVVDNTGSMVGSTSTGSIDTLQPTLVHPMSGSSE